MTPLRNQFSDYSKVEVGWHDFLLGPTTSSHKLPPPKANMKIRLKLINFFVNNYF